MNKITVFLVFLAATAQGQFLAPTNQPPTVQHIWNQDANTSVTNYFVYEGTNTGQYTVKIPAGTNLVLTVSNLLRGVEYFFNVTAQADGLESGFGGEINYTPVAPPPSPTFKPIIVLTVQNTPNLLTPWGTLETVSLSANQKTGFFRMKISTQ